MKTVFPFAPSCRIGPIGRAFRVTHHGSRTARRSAFSLVEILVTVGLLSFIILGLLAMFHQTQRAFRSSITQTDVLEAGRAVTTTILGPEIEQISASQAPNVVNFFAEIDPNGGFTEPLLQTLAGANPGSLRRTNIVQRVYFLTEVNEHWTGTGYQVIPIAPNAGVGTLYRFTTNAPKYDLSVPLAFFSQSATRALDLAAQGYPLTNLPPGVDRVIEGVVHFRMRACAPNGFPIIFTNGVAGAYYHEDPYSGRVKPVEHTAVAARPLYDSLQSDIICRSNAVPAFVELELGILEPQLIPRLKSLPPQAQRGFLENQAPRVHLFRQTIPVRNVDYEAYP